MKMKAIVPLPLLALLTVAVDAQEREATGRSAPSADSDRSQIVGHWVAEKTSSSGLGSVWEFKPDGTLAAAAATRAVRQGRRGSGRSPDPR
jgi:hypothetical protein